MVEMFCICAVHYGSFQLHVTIEHWKNVTGVTEGLNFYFYLILIKFKEPHVVPPI